MNTANSQKYIKIHRENLLLVCLTVFLIQIFDEVHAATNNSTQKISIENWVV